MPFCVQNQMRYRREVWSIMHRTDSPNTASSALRLYLDESGGSDPNTPVAIVAGVLITREWFEEFENSWDSLLADYGIAPPLHMKEFGVHGRLGHLSICCKRELFGRVADLINSHHTKTISASISNAEYIELIPSAARKKFSVYGMCFILVAFLNHLLAQANSYEDRIPFILDTGNPYKNHVVEAHAWMIESQREDPSDFLNVGALTFDDDKDFGILQAADVVAWATRRKRTQGGSGLTGHYAPLEKIFNQNHIYETWTPELLSKFGDRLSKMI
jgi:hypothetical protein